ncbi:response regulator [Megalodesulfovibrio paquesii]
MVDNYTVLIVDDDKFFADKAQRELSTTEITTFATYDIDSAKSFAKSNKIDLAILDIKLPLSSTKTYLTDNGGFIVCSFIRELHPLATVVMLTAFDSSANAVKSLKNLNASNYIAKSGSDDEDIKRLYALITQDFETSFYKAAKPNPFRVQLGEYPDRAIEFRGTGLKNYIRRILSGNDVPTRALIFGPRAMGKSCTLHFIKSLFTKKGFNVSAVSLSPELSENSFNIYAADFCKELATGFHASTSTTWTSLGEFFNKVGIEIGLPFVGKISIARDGNMLRTQSYQDLLHGGLAAISKSLQGSSKPTVTIIDNLDSLINFPVFFDAFMNNLTEHLLTNVNRSYFFASLTSLHPALERQNCSNFVRHFSGNLYQVEPFTFEESHFFISQSLADTGVYFQEDLIAKIHLVTDGHPYPLGVICHYLYEGASIGAVTIAGFDNAFQRAEHELALYLNHPFDNISHDALLLLRIIAVHGPQANSRAFLFHIPDNRSDLLNIERVQIILYDLQKSGHIIIANGYYTISSELFRNFIYTHLGKFFEP